jgi:phenylacetate-CoA ligase
VLHSTGDNPDFEPDAEAEKEIKAVELSAALDLADIDAFLLVLRDMAQKKGMTRLARDIGVNRESLYKTLSPGSQPRFETILSIIRGFGLSVNIQAGKRPPAPAEAAANARLRGSFAVGGDSGLLYQFAERVLQRSITPKLRILRQEAALPFARRKALAVERLALTLAGAGRTVPYYRDLFRRHKFTAEKVLLDARHMEELPYLTPDIVREQGKRLLGENCALPVIREFSAGGEGGLNIAFYHDQESLDWITANNIITLEWGGKRRDDREARVSAHSPPQSGGTGLRPEFIKNLLLNRKNVHMAGHSAADMEKLLRELRNAGARTIQGPASGLSALAAYIRQTGASGGGLFEIFFSTGENLSDAQRELIASVFCARVYNRYGSHEFGVLAQETEQGPHGALRVADSLVWPEVAPPERTGEKSELVFTSLRNSAMPLIRYRRGDRGELGEDAEGSLITEIEYSPAVDPDFV